MAEHRAMTVLQQYEKNGLMPRNWDSLDYLNLLIFAEKNNFGAAVSALKRMKAAFIDYNDIRVARFPEVARVLDPLQDADACVKRMVDMLFRLYDTYGMMSLQTLSHLNASDAKQAIGKVEPHLPKEAVQIVLYGLVPNCTPAVSDAALNLARNFGIIAKTGTRVNLQKVLADSGLPPEKCAKLVLFLEIDAAVSAKKNPPKKSASANSSLAGKSAAKSSKNLSAKGKSRAAQERKIAKSKKSSRSSGRK